MSAIDKHEPTRTYSNPTAIEALERRIDELCAEVERLRNQLHNQQDTAEHNLVRNAREYKRVCDENARLRELAARVDRARRDLCNAYPDAEMLTCEECPAWSACKGDLADCMRELGVDDG